MTEEEQEIMAGIAELRAQDQSLQVVADTLTRGGREFSRQGVRHIARKHGLNRLRRHTMTMEERTTRLEGEIGHMATKADIETVCRDIAAVRGKFGKQSATPTSCMILIAGAFQAVESGALIQLLPCA